MEIFQTIDVATLQRLRKLIVNFSLVRRVLLWRHAATCMSLYTRTKAYFLNQFSGPTDIQKVDHKI